MSRKINRRDFIKLLTAGTGGTRDRILHPRDDHGCRNPGGY